MKTIILPGYSASNKNWAEDIKKNLVTRSNLVTNVIIQHWPHWSGGSMSIPKETKKLADIIGKDSVNIIAKSVGTKVAMGVVTDTINIHKLILCGIPTKGDSDAARKNYSPLKSIDSYKVIVFQNIKDPLANYSDIKKFIYSINPKIKVIEKPRSDHSYPYPEDFSDFLSS